MLLASPAGRLIVDSSDAGCSEQCCVLVPVLLMPGPEVGVSMPLPFRDGGFMSGEIKEKKCIIKNLVGLVSQGKSQSQDFIDKFRGLGHTLVQRSFLLLSVLQIVDSRPLWILVSVLGSYAQPQGLPMSYRFGEVGRLA